MLQFTNFFLILRNRKALLKMVCLKTILSGINIVQPHLRCVRKVAVHLGYGVYIWLSVPKLPLQRAVVSLYSVVKQRLKCNTGKVWDCLIQFVLTVVSGHHFQRLL
jgi:hypothetical protein